MMNEHLDDLLAAWAAQVRLPAAEADAMRRRILATPPPTPAVLPRPRPGAGLPATWWRGVAQQVADVIVQASRPPLVAVPLSPATAWGAAR